MCTFFNVDALARAGRLTEAALTFQKMFTHANQLPAGQEVLQEAPRPRPPTAAQDPRRPARSGPGDNQRRHVPPQGCLARLHGVSVLEINKHEACRTRTSSRPGSHDKEQLVRSTDHEQIGDAEEHECRG